MNQRLGYQPGEPKPSGQTTERNGASGKTEITERGPVRGDLRRDRSFEPILIPTHERRFTGFDERIIAMYARGMSDDEAVAELLATVLHEKPGGATHWSVRSAAAQTGISKRSMARYLRIQAWGGCDA